MRTLLSIAGLVALIGSAAAAQTTDEPNPGPAILSTGTVNLVVGGTSHPLAVTFTSIGPLFDLAPLAGLAGATLVSGALGHSWELEVGESRAIFGLSTSTLTIGRKLVSLSQPPRAGPGGVHVPLDLLHETLGTGANLEIEWIEASSALTVSRRAAREVPVTIEIVDLPGVTTLVVQFSTRVRTRVVPRDNGLRLEILGDRLLAPLTLPSSQGGFLRRLVVASDAIELDTAPGTSATSYELDPQRFVIDLQAALRAAPTTSPPTPTAPPTVIVLDPGHGGDESGAIGPSGSREKELVLILAQSLKRRLEDRLGVRVVLTRDDDVNLSLDARSAIANQHQAALFVSLHLNSAWGGRARATGAETYFLSLAASDARAAESAAFENRSVPTSDDPELDEDLRLILWDLAQTHHLGESQRFARIVQEELDGALGLRDRGVKQAPFRVLMGAAMPAVLVELGLISNPEEERRLLDPEYRSRLVDALVRAIQRFRSHGRDLDESIP